MIARVLANESAKFLHALQIRLAKVEAERYFPTLPERLPRTLRKLELWAAADLGRLEPLLRAIPKIHELQIAARAFEVGTIALPFARSVRLNASSLSKETVSTVARAAWPHLEQLELRICSKGKDGTTTSRFDDVRPLVERTDFPKLKDVRIRGAPYLGTVLRALCTSPIAGQIEVLDVGGNRIAPADMDYFLEHREAFGKLAVIFMDFDGLTRRHRAAVGKFVDEVAEDALRGIDTLTSMSALVPRDSNVGED